MYEVEWKVRVGHDAVRRSIERMGARHESTVHHRDRYFTHPSRDFSETDEALRLRRIHGGTESDVSSSRLTYKGPRIGDVTKTREEFESGVEHHDQVCAILDALGFEPLAVVEKRRETYRQGNVHICLDDVIDLGEFVEIEVAGERDTLDEARREGADILREIGIELENTITKSYLEMCLEASTE